MSHPQPQEERRGAGCGFGCPVAARSACGGTFVVACEG
jgi:hypothetical protein